MWVKDGGAIAGYNGESEDIIAVGAQLFEEGSEALEQEEDMRTGSRTWRTGLGALPCEYAKSMTKGAQGFDKMVRDIESDRKNRSTWKARRK